MNKGPHDDKPSCEAAGERLARRGRIRDRLAPAVVAHDDLGAGRRGTHRGEPRESARRRRPGGGRNHWSDHDRRCAATDRHHAPTPTGSTTEVPWEPSTTSTTTGQPSKAPASTTTAPTTPALASSARRGRPDGGRAAQAATQSEQAGERQPHPDQSQISPELSPRTAAKPRRRAVRAPRLALPATWRCRLSSWPARPMRWRRCSAARRASAQALDFYRIPLFLLPIYRAAAIQYDVPWPILAAINEIETDYGTDLSVSSAGAEGWMQFEPSTWLQYGVDALNAGYADPYNPVDAIFAAARYLRAAGASTNLRTAILAYNHSEAYAELGAAASEIDRRLPRSGDRHADGPHRRTATGDRQAHRLEQAPATRRRDRRPALPPSSSATAGATATRRQRLPSPARPAPRPRRLRAPPRTPRARPGVSLQLADVTSEPHARAVAVQDGRVVKLGDSRKLGRYVILQDVYGDVFTYAGLAASPRPIRHPSLSPLTSVSGSAPGASTPPGAASSLDAAASASGSTATGGARCACSRIRATPTRSPRLAPTRTPRASTAGRRRPLRSGSVVTEGTVLGQVDTPPGARDGHLRFSIRPTGDASTIDPRAILSNWAQLDAALHPQGAKGSSEPARRDRERRIPAVQEPARARGAVRPWHCAVVLLAPRSRHGGDRQACAGGARVPLAQRPEAERRHAGLRRGGICDRGLRGAWSHRRRESRSSRSTASRSPATRVRARSPTRRFAHCSRCRASTCPPASSA